MLVVDIETSGTDRDRHSILSIGAVDLTEPKRQFSGECQIRSGAEITDQALTVNGYTKEQIIDPSKPSEGELLLSFLDWLDEAAEHTIGGQNVHFDAGFLTSAAKRAGQIVEIEHRLIDLHSICWVQMVKRGIEPPVQNKVSALSLDRIAEYTGLPPEPRPHLALNGAKWEAEAFSRLIYDQGLWPEFEQYPVPWLYNTSDTQNSPC